MAFTHTEPRTRHCRRDEVVVAAVLVGLAQCRADSVGTAPPGVRQSNAGRRSCRRSRRECRSSPGKHAGCETPCGRTVNGRQTWPKPPRGAHVAVGRRTAGCRSPGRVGVVGLRPERARGPLVARAVGVAEAAWRRGRRRASCSGRSMQTNFPWSLSHFAQSASLSHGTVHRSRRSASSGSSSLMHLPTMQSMSDSHRKPSRPGDADARVAGARELAEAEVIGRAAIVRVAVGDADVGRVRRRIDQLGQARLPGRARRVAGDAAALQAIQVIRAACPVCLALELLEEGRGARRTHGVGTVAILGARFHRHADALVRRDVGAQAAEVVAAARVSACSGRTPGAWLAPARRPRLRSRSVIGCVAARSVQKSVPSSWLAGKQVIALAVCDRRRSRDRAPPCRTRTRAHRTRPRRRCRPAAEARQTAATRTAAMRAPRPRRHLSMLLTNGASGALGASSRYSL